MLSQKTSQDLLRLQELLDDLINYIMKNEHPSKRVQCCTQLNGGANWLKRKWFEKWFGPSVCTIVLACGDRRSAQTQWAEGLIQRISIPLIHNSQVYRNSLLSLHARGAKIWCHFQNPQSRSYVLRSTTTDVYWRCHHWALYILGSPLTRSSIVPTT